MAAFVDPRTNPAPPAPDRPLGDDPQEIAALTKLCRTGRVYAVEEWIREGKPLWVREVPRRRFQSPLRVAIDSKQFDLALLLLCNGFPPDTGESLLSYALAWNRLPYVELLLRWGADPLQVHPRTILQSYDGRLLDRFWERDVNYTRDHELARALATHSSNRPLYGWAKRHSDDPRVQTELAMGLAHAVNEDKERAVALLLWAGADPHLRVPDLRFPHIDDPSELTSAVMSAISARQGKYLPVLRIDPEREDVQELWRHVRDKESADYLAQIVLPEEWSETIIHNIHWLTYGFNDAWETKGLLDHLGRLGACLTTIEEKRLKDLRRAIIRGKPEEMRWVLRWLKAHSDAAIYQELTRTPAVHRLRH